MFNEFKVVCIDDRYCDEITIGKIYTVKDVDNRLELYIIYNDDSNSDHLSISRFVNLEDIREKKFIQLGIL